MKERRRSPRHPVDNLRGVVQFKTDARLLNVSLTGAALELTSPIRPGGGYSLDLQNRGAEVRMRATAIWCQEATARPDDGGKAVPVFHAGLRFDDVLRPEGEQVLGMFRESVVLSFGQRACTRFRLPTPRPAQLVRENAFEVRRLSATGMLIDTDLAAELDTVVEIDLPLGPAPLHTLGRIACIITGAGEEPAAGEGESPESPYRLGVEFQGLSEEDRRAIAGYLEGLESRAE